jgi:hypothetical protein
MLYEQISAMNGVLWVVIPCRLVEAYHILEESAACTSKEEDGSSNSDKLVTIY